MSLRIDDLMAYGRESRKLRAYAYLTAFFRTSPQTAGTIDCLLPFLAAGVKAQSGNFLDIEELGRFLQVEIGLIVPIYVMQQLVPALQGEGLLEWNDSARRYLCRKGSIATEPSQEASDLGSAFDALEAELKRFAQTHEVSSPLASKSWSDALIGFLRSDTAGEISRSAKVRDVLIGDTIGLESYLVARFIQEAQSAKQDVFDLIIQVFTGILIEDFINNIQEVGDTSRYHQLNVYYDTTVLLRLLGTSGTIFRTATLEMHRVLQDLGCKCWYLEYTEDELFKILESIVTTHDAGGDIFNETAEAILNQEISIGQIRDLAVTFRERIAEKGIFAFRYNYNQRKAEDVFQVDERSLATAFVAEASKRDRSYKENSALNDARAIAIVIRLRKGVARAELSGCGHMFVSRNPVLQVAAKRFVQRNVEGYDGQAIPPALTVGQVTTFAWLATARSLAAHQVTSELLANCYNAVRPSANWTMEFSRALEQFRSENLGFVEARANAALFLQVARSSARDESLNQPAVLRKANLSEIFKQAADEADARQRLLEEQFEQEKIELRAAAETDKRQAAIDGLRKEQEAEDLLRRIAERAKEELAETERRFQQHALAAAESAREHEVEAQRSKQRSLVERRAASLAHWVLRGGQVIVAAVATVVALLFNIDYWASGTATKIVSGILLAIIVAPSLLDLLGWEMMSAHVRLIERNLARVLFVPVAKALGYSLDQPSRKEPMLQSSPKKGAPPPSGSI